MRIDAFNKVSQMYKANGTSKVNQANKPGKADSVQISKQGKEFQVAKQAVLQSSDIRTDKVEAIKSQMVAGTYQVSNKDVADKLVERYFDTKI